MRNGSESQVAHPLVHVDPKVEHQRLVEDATLWQRLQFQGIQSGLGTELFEMRGCPCCGSTLNRAITAQEALILLGDQCGMVSRTLLSMELRTL